jgi:hypothetical protein
MDLSREARRALGNQSGVISRRQAIQGGLTKSDIDRLVRRRWWVRMLPGVYVDHTGEPTWVQRAWAGVLYYEPAALAGISALRMVAGPGWRHHDDAGPVWIGVAADRHVAARPGYRIRYLTRLDEQVHGHTHPPRMRFEEACLDLVATTRSRLDRVQILAGACQSRRTTAERLLTVLTLRTRMPDRAWLEAVLHDIDEGTCSVLEHGYLTLVERPHGLPRGQRQRPERDSSGRVYRDVAYPPYGELVELDGLLGHDSPVARDADLERDLDAAVTGRGTVRLGWGQVFGRPCRTAGKIGTLLTNRGWTGTIRRCGPDCQVA